VPVRVAHPSLHLGNNNSNSSYNGSNSNNINSDIKQAWKYFGF
jgi:hypothetical protein